MQILRIKTIIVLAAAVLSAWDGITNILSVLVFSSHESSRLWVSIYLPATLWLIALSCFRVPRFGATLFIVVWLTSVLLCFDPLHHSLRERVGSSVSTMSDCQ